MKLHQSLLPAALILISAVATLTTTHGASLAINNGNFETNATTLVPNDGNFTFGDGGVPEWDDNFPLGNASGLFNPDTFSAPSGISVLFLDAGGYVVQDLELSPGVFVNAEPSSTITISGQINNRFSSPSLLLQASLRVLPNNNILSPIQIDPVDTAGWNPFTATFNLPDAATLGGAANQPLFLVFDGIGGQVNVDDITGTFTPVPEPSITLLGGIGLLALLRLRRS